nr:MBL fold metallo-hydrolase [Saprospiraceae bacterium]
MKIEQIYTGCLAHGAYYIESRGEAVVIDPLRDYTPYVKKAEMNGAKIKYILETHFHADFVSGHLDLARATGAPIVFGPTAEPGFEAHIARDGEELKVGDITLVVLHTPGHTMESTTYLLRDEKGKDRAIFSGDTLFIGDVGRPDLAVKTDLSMEDLAGHLYDSLRNKIMTLPEEVIIYPGHGAGSACGKNLSEERWDTLGNQKKLNYALRPNMSREDFVKEVTEGLLAPPQYFPKNAMLNKMGYESIDTAFESGLQSLSPEKFEAAANEFGALVLDTRNPEDFAAGHIPNSINIGLDGDFAPWVGALIKDLSQPILIVSEKGREEEAVTRLARVGYDHSIGFLENGFSAWKESGSEYTTIETLSPQRLAEDYVPGKIKLVDVRKPGEYQAEHVDGAVNVPLDFLNEEMDTLSSNEKMYLHCAGGYRSMIAASILKARGFDQLVNVDGGFDQIKLTSIPKTEYVCPSTLV